MENKKHLVAVTAIIKNQYNKILVVKRGANEIAYAGKWAYPGGKVEKGETIMQALKREILEEVGIEIEDYKELLQDYTFVKPDGNNVVGLNFLVRAKNKEVKLSEEFQDYKWVNLSELMGLDRIPEIEISAKQVLSS